MYPGTHSPRAVGRQLWTLVCHHTYPQTFKGAPLTSAHFLQLTLTEQLDCSPSKSSLRSRRIVSGSVQINTNERVAIVLDNGQAVLVRTGDCPLSGSGFRGPFTHGY